MSGTDALIALLRPLGVYTFREGSFSMAELQALGAQFDALRQETERVLRESIVSTAEAEGLSMREALFPWSAAAESTDARRRALIGFLQIAGDSFTLDAINRCVSACVNGCVVEETGTPNDVRVRFPDVMGIPEGFARICQIVQMILPCQLRIEYVFCWCTWGQTQDYGLTWNDLGAMTWQEWQVYKK